VSAYPGVYEEGDAYLVVRDAIDGGAASAEEGAIHVVNDDDSGQAGTP
jgi:hypothetical protein